MFIGPKGKQNLKVHGIQPLSFENPIFDINQCEINDQNATIEINIANLNRVHLSGNPVFPVVHGSATVLGNVLFHEPLYQAYPHLRSMPVVNATDFPNDKNWVKEWEGVAAAFVAGNGKNDLLAVEPKAGNMIGLSIMLHEVQHAIQAYEGYFAGALISPNPDPPVDRAMHYACPQEREAYNVESRFCGGKKKWFEEENPMFAGYPKRLPISKWEPRMLKHLEAFLRRDEQRAIFKMTLEVRSRILAAAVA